MRRFTVLGAVSLIALAAASAASAQDRQPVQFGQIVEGALSQGDATDPDAGFLFDEYEIRLNAGQRVDIIMRAPDFDTYLDAWNADQPDSNHWTDDDGLGEELNSRLRFTAPTDGTYVIRARPFGEGEGSYTLAITESAAPGPEPRPQAIRLGQSLEGEIAAGDPEDGDGRAYDVFSFRATAGERVAISLASEAFDPLVQVGRGAGQAFERLGENDDAPGGGTLNSYLVFTAPERGEYVIRALPLSANREGAYTLSLAEPAPPPQAAPIRLGADALSGNLADDATTTEAGNRADLYTFRARAGQRVEITMSSEDFDTYLALVGPDGAIVGEDDDGGEGVNSRLIRTLTQAGDYVIQARSFADGGTGAYLIAVKEIEPERPPQAMAFGATIQGEIVDADPEDGDGRHYDSYSFTGVEGQRIQAIMRSGDFDTYLQIGSADGEFSASMSDDDGLGEGTDSRLTYTLPADGTYVIRASPLVSSSDGLYSLELIDRGPKPLPGSVLVGATARGTLSETDAIGDDGGYFDAWRFQAKADEKLVITMVSNEFDSFLWVASENEDGSLELLASDDDSLSDVHARLEWTAPEDGTYVIRAGSFAPNQTGAYAVRIEKAP